MAARRFSCRAPNVWNSLPSFVRTADSFTSFRSQLKTYVRKTSVAGPLYRASDTLTGTFARYKFVTYLLTNLQTKHVFTASLTAQLMSDITKTYI